MLNTSTRQGYRERLERPDYINMQPLQGIAVAERILRSCVSGKTLIYFDPDMDGLVAGKFFADVLNHLGIEFETFVNSNREHGFQLSGADYAGWTILNGDFLVTEEQALDLLKHNVSLLSIDHHECQSGMIHYKRLEDGEVVPGELWGFGRDSKVNRGVESSQGTAEAIVINNQYPFEDPRNLFQSGAGVTFLALKDSFPFLDTHENRVLVGVTLITDVRDLEAEGAHAWLYEAYHSRYEGELARIINALTAGKRQYEYGIPSMDRSFVSFTLSPKLNALFRFNREDDAVAFILGGDYPHIDYQAEQKKLVSSIKDKAKILECDNIRFVKLDGNSFHTSEYAYLSNFVGLVASNLTDTRSVIAWSTDYMGRVVRASFRGVLTSARYRELLEEVIDGRGHNIAFGIKDFTPTAQLCAKINTVVGTAEDEAHVLDNYIPVPSLARFNQSLLTIIAERNDYLLEQNVVYLKYTGGSIIEKTMRETFQEYIIDGVSVKSFDGSLDPREDYILPVLSKGVIRYRLTKKYNEGTANEVDTKKHLAHKKIIVR